MKEPWSPIYVAPDSQQPGWRWSHGRKHESFARLLIDDNESESAPHHSEADVRTYYHLGSCVFAKAKFKRGQVSEKLLKEVSHVRHSNSPKRACFRKTSAWFLSRSSLKKWLECRAPQRPITRRQNITQPTLDWGCFHDGDNAPPFTLSQLISNLLTPIFCRREGNLALAQKVLEVIFHPQYNRLPPYAWLVRIPFPTTCECGSGNIGRC